MSKLSRVFRALANERRRTVLSAVQEHRAVSLPDLAELVVESEREVDVAEVSEEAVRDVYMALYHEHVPPLEEAELIRYEADHDVVTVTDRCRPALVRAREETNAIVAVT